MKQRTEEDAFRRTPIEVTLGTEKYGLKPLARTYACIWREKLTQTMQGIVGSMSAEQSTTTLGPALTAALVAFPDKVAELVYAWAPELPVEKINAEATEEQLALAFSAIMVMAYPFLAQLAMTVQVTKSQLK
jgi:hypothetical protein